MPLNFVAQYESAVDVGTGLLIHSPRLLPATAPDDIEYQYSIYRDGLPWDGLGLFGSEAMEDRGGRQQRVFTLDMGRDPVLDSVFRLKRALGSKDDDFDFLQGLARGLVAVYETRTDNDAEVRYVALTRAGLLEDRGIALDGEMGKTEAGEIILAEVVVPAHAIGA